MGYPMSEEKVNEDVKKEEKKLEQVCKKGIQNQGGGAVYCLGLLGALWYYLSTATGFWMGVWGVVKAILWPAFFVYKIFEYLGM